MPLNSLVAISSHYRIVCRDSSRSTAVQVFILCTDPSYLLAPTRVILATKSHWVACLYPKEICQFTWISSVELREEIYTVLHLLPSPRLIVQYLAENLDLVLAHRPSCFDIKYSFPCPAKPDRIRTASIGGWPDFCFIFFQVPRYPVLNGA